MGVIEALAVALAEALSAIVEVDGLERLAVFSFAHVPALPDALRVTHVNVQLGFAPAGLRAPILIFDRAAGAARLRAGLVGPDSIIALAIDTALDDLALFARDVVASLGALVAGEVLPGLVVGAVASSGLRRLVGRLVRGLGILRAARVLVVVGTGGLARTVGLVSSALVARAAVAALARGIAVVAAVRAVLNGLVRGLVRRPVRLLLLVFLLLRVVFLLLIFVPILVLSLAILLSLRLEGSYSRRRVVSLIGFTSSARRTRRDLL